MKAIVAVSREWGIGRDNSLLFSIPEDMKQFKEITTGHIVVMGRKTLESLPEGKPLKNRINIVLTKNIEFDCRGALIVHSISELQEVLQRYPSEEVFVIGGGSIYKVLMPWIDTVYVTKVDRSAKADTFFPNLDDNPSWQIVNSSENKEHDGLTFRFVIYERKEEICTENIPE